MLKGLQSGFSKFFTNQRVLILVIFLLLCFVLTSYASSKGYTAYEGMKETFEKEVTEDSEAEAEAEAAALEDSEDDSEGFQNMTSTAASVNSPSDLLPKNSNKDLVGSFKTEEGIFPGNLLEAGSHIGLDTVSSSMRNANLQLRADPTITKKSGCWWGESTIHPDPNPIGLKV
tara:strand:- start:687 stop:1205 length:519 start_codon:yes stop_codon:yes gene_type:complete